MPMAENDATASGAQTVPPSQAAHPPFPGVRLLYAIAYSIVAWFVFWIVLLLALVQFVTILVSGKINDELRHFSINLVQYLL
jgi:type IV secretory pathway TrbL component